MRSATAIMSIATVLALAGCGAARTAQQPEPKAFVVYFQSGSAELTPEAQQIVAEIATAARNAEHPEITIEGVADRSDDHDLTARRTAAVGSALQADGVADATVTLRGADETANAHGIAARRVRVTLVAQQN